jgi:pimeloyl-ACP methyl ester carboxylesterase
MKRLLSTILVAALSVAALAPGPTRANDDARGSHGHHPGDLSDVNVVLVHGAFADGNSWSKVIPLLQARGLHVVAVQNPLSSLPDDAAATERAIEQQTGSVVLVGHSWAGVVITEAGNNDKVKELVYVDAFAPDTGQSINDLLAGLPPPPYAALFVKDSAGFLTLPETGIDTYFAQDLPRDEVRLITATQGPWAQRCFADKVTRAAWHSKPSIWVLGTQDRFIAPALQEKMSATIGAAVIRVPSSHVSLLSHPRAVADAIIAAAEDAASPWR